MKQCKIAMVTGGSRGLGKNISLSLAKKGVDVILTYNQNKERALEVVKEIEGLGQKAAALQLDIATTAGFDTYFNQLKRVLKDVFNTDSIDFLVNNAGVSGNAPFSDTKEEQFDQLMNIHFKSTFFLTQKALNVMANGGGIVNISTGLTRFTYPGYMAYASMKSAVETMTKYQAKELGSRGIRANVVAPGAIETDFSGGAVRDNKELNNHIASVTALGRAGLPDDIGGVVAFLCTTDAKWVNAQRIEVSGGQMI